MLQPNPAVGDTIAEQRRVLHTIERLADWTLGDLVKGSKFWIVTSIAPAIAIGGVSHHLERCWHPHFSPQGRGRVGLQTTDIHSVGLFLLP